MKRIIVIIISLLFIVLSLPVVTNAEEIDTPIEEPIIEEYDGVNVVNIVKKNNYAGSYRITSGNYYYDFTIKFVTNGTILYLDGSVDTISLSNTATLFDYDTNDPSGNLVWSVTNSSYYVSSNTVYLTATIRATYRGKTSYFTASSMYIYS
ncbi:MAG: hypothetical protein IJJ19_00330 [Erysipelotrichaceae bacterium]|nr:hypothetical protein [Erysipelotrichaceae bacterium]